MDQQRPAAVRLARPCARRSPTPSTVSDREARCSAARRRPKPANTLNPPSLADYSDHEAWADYKLDLDKVDELMTGDGWDEGRRRHLGQGRQEDVASTINTTAGNKRRELTEQVIQQQLKEAGFDMTIKNADARRPVRTIVPKGDYDLIALRPERDVDQPGLCTLFCSENIPGPANDNSGHNWTRQRPRRRRAAAHRRHEPRRRRAPGGGQGG